MAIAVSQDYGEAPLKYERFKKKEIAREVIENVLKDYQYSSKSVMQIAQDYGLSNYMVNKIASEAKRESGLIKRKERNTLARRLLKVNDIDWEGFDDTQMDYIVNYSKTLRDNSKKREQKSVHASIYDIKKSSNGNDFDLAAALDDNAVELPRFINDGDEEGLYKPQGVLDLREEIETDEAVKSPEQKSFLGIKRENRLVRYDCPEGFEREARKKYRATRLEKILSSPLGSFAKNVLFGLALAASSFYIFSSIIKNNPDDYRNYEVSKAYSIINHSNIIK